MTNHPMTNRFHGLCDCGNAVPAHQGTLERTASRRWRVVCRSCNPAGTPEVTTVRTSSGWTGTRNARGRCEDAPCCGCCTF